MNIDLNMEHKKITFNGIFFMQENKVLLLKRKGTGFLDGWRWIPGGHLDYGEFFSDAAIREVEEETGICIVRKYISSPTILYSHCSQRNHSFLWWYTLCQRWEGEPINNEPDKCSKISWFPVDQLPKQVVPSSKIALQWLLEGRSYIEVESETCRPTIDL